MIYNNNDDDHQARANRAATYISLALAGALAVCLPRFFEVLLIHIFYIFYQNHQLWQCLPRFFEVLSSHIFDLVHQFHQPMVTIIITIKVVPVTHCIDFRHYNFYHLIVVLISSSSKSLFFISYHQNHLSSYHNHQNHHCSHHNHNDYHQGCTSDHCIDFRHATVVISHLLSSIYHIIKIIWVQIIIIKIIWVQIIIIKIIIVHITIIMIIIKVVPVTHCIDFRHCNLPANCDPVVFQWVQTFIFICF